MTELSIKGLHIEVEGEEIVKGVTLSVKSNEIVAIMGPNGSGKSTLVNTVMGHPKYKVTNGEILMDNKNMTDASPDERAKAGLFLSFQYPSEVSGVSIANFLRTAVNELRGIKMSVPDFMKLLKERMQLLEMDSSFAKRYLNEGFSGGEKKRNEILQLAVLEPKIALLDETDSGLDIDALKAVANSVNKVREKTGMGVLVVTHYQRLLNYIKPDKVHIMIEGKIIKSGGAELALEIEEKGYEWVNAETE
ncbi:Fe-S cluster assembly ATPase SufC [Candidatus Woesearchaeota archaeon]|nr:Fe-S cluster assembly ATPase SufC [Candidatus Woesearchaeota archaeon]